MFCGSVCVLLDYAFVNLFKLRADALLTGRIFFLIVVIIVKPAGAIKGKVGA